MIRVPKRDDISVPGVQSRYLDGEVVRFTSRVHEIRDRKVTRHLRRKLPCQIRQSGMQVDRRSVLKLPDLILDGLRNLRMAVPARNGDNACEHVEIPLAGFVPQPLHVPLDDHDRLAIDREDRRVCVLLPHRENFSARGTRVRSRLVAARRHWHHRALGVRFGLSWLCRSSHQAVACAASVSLGDA